MIRWWNEAVATLADVGWGGVPGLAFFSFLATVLISLAWYFWPHWLPWNWRVQSGSGRSGSRAGAAGGRGRRFRFGSLRWRWRLRWRRKKRGRPEPLDDLPADALPDLPAEMLTLTADQLAAAGRYAEAVRERLRAIVRDLIERGVLPHSPGWTVTELATAAIQARPALAPSLRGAVDVFSEIWYGLRRARVEDDTAMRAHASDIKEIIAEPVGVSGSGA